MPMTPEEYVKKEFNVPGYTGEEPVYAPGENPSEFDPNILLVMNGGVAHKPNPTPEPEADPKLLEMATEYNFALPLDLRRAEVILESSKHLHLNAKTNFWNSLALAIVLTPILAFIAVLVK